jgi:hypothetical protein
MACVLFLAISQPHVASTHVADMLFERGNMSGKWGLMFEFSFTDRSYINVTILQLCIGIAMKLPVTFSVVI